MINGLLIGKSFYNQQTIINKNHCKTREESKKINDEK
jgi:hypothetical protein